MNIIAETSNFTETRRAFEICNACRYCEGYCAVFPDMFRHRQFTDGDISHLANLCHNCKGCWHACQYAPPHEFGLNLPATLAATRADTYAQHAWPKPLGRLFQRNGTFVAMATALAIFAVLLAAMFLVDDTVMTAVHQGEGAFYAVIPHDVMVWLGTLTFGWAIIAMILGVRAYWRATGGGPVPVSAIAKALKDAGSTRYLSGRGEGCNDLDEGFSQARRHYHLATMWGFLLCFAATSAGTVMDYLFGWQAPYSWYSLPVLSGTIGGVMLMVGTAGLFWIKFRTDREPEAPHLWGMDVGLLSLLFFTAATGLALLFWRHTGAMGWLLALHLGFVLALFVTLPYGKFVHGIYRLAALIRYHRDMENS